LRKDALVCYAPPMGVWYKRSAQKALRRLPDRERSRIEDKLVQLAQNPYAPDSNVRPLQGLKDCFRRRFGDIRVSYEILEDGIEVFEVAYRGSAYRCMK